MKSWLIKSTVFLVLLLSASGILFSWNEARKEVFYLCENFEPGMTRSNVVRQLNTANYLNLVSTPKPFGEELLAGSFFGPLTRTCQIEFDDAATVMFAAITPFRTRQQLLNNVKFNVIGAPSNDLIVTNPQDMVLALERHPTAFVLVRLPFDSNSIKALRRELEALFGGEARRVQLQRIVPFYTGLCDLQADKLEEMILYSKDNFAGTAWSTEKSCPPSRVQFVLHQAERVYRLEGQ